MLPDQFALLLTDFLNHGLCSSCPRIVKDIKPNDIAFTLCLSQNAIFPFRAGFHANIMGCNPLKHILTFTYVNNLIVQHDTVDAWELIFLR